MSFTKLLRNEGGYVLPFFGIILLTLFALAALFFDFSRTYSSDVEFNSAADVAAINVLELYQDLDDPSNQALFSGVTFPAPLPSGVNPPLVVLAYQQQLHNAKLEVIEDEVRKQLITYGAMINNGANAVNNADDIFVQKLDGTDITNVASTVANSTVHVEAGFWYFGDPGCSTGYSGGDSSCPCSGATYLGDCFYTNTAAGEPVNSIRLTMRTPDNDPNKTLFGNIVGFKNIAGITASSVSASAPRHVLFGMDLSPSIVSTSHPYIPANDDGGADAFSPTSPPVANTGVSNFSFAYQMNQAVCPVAIANVDGNTANPDIVCTSSDPGAAADFGYSFAAAPHDFFDISAGQCGCDFNGTAQCAIGDPADSVAQHVRHTGHFMDYVDDLSSDPFFVWGPNHAVDQYHCYSSATGTAWLLDGGPTVDSFPQPLFATLGAVNQGITLLQQRSNNSDRIGLYGFDHRMPDVAPWSVRDFGLNLVGSTGAIQTLTDFSYITWADKKLHYESLANSLFFPVLEARSDIGGAMAYGATVFENLTGPNAQSSFVERNYFLVTDGLANCSDIGDGAGYNCNVPADPDLRFRRHFNGLTETLNNARVMIDKGVKIHVAFFSNLVAPHTLLRKSVNTPGQCMRDKEARELRKTTEDAGTASDRPDLGEYVRGEADFSRGDGLYYEPVKNAYLNYTNPAVPYFYPGEFLYETIVRPSGGLFVPVRPACNPSDLGLGSVAACNSGGEAALDAYCSAAAVAPTYTHTTLSPGPTDSELGIVTVPNVTDSSGRLLCDPQCRTPEEQMRDAMDGFFRQNPHILVYEG